MTKGQRPYDLEDRLIDFAVTVIDLIEGMPDTRAANHVASQLVRAGTSPAPNYGEAQGAESRRDFAHKLKICLKELKESRVWLKIVKRKSMVKTATAVDAALQECEELIQIFAKSIATAEAKARE